MDRYKTAFTLVELILVVFLLSIVAVIAIPRLSYSASSGQKVDCLAKKIVTDLRRTRMLAISNAAKPGSSSFTLEMTGTAHYYSGYRIVDDSNGAVVDSQTIGLTVVFVGDSQFCFGPLGSLQTSNDAVIQFHAQGRYYRIIIRKATGMVQCDRLS